jgi:outer membrane protein assembly factor BamB
VRFQTTISCSRTVLLAVALASLGAAPAPTVQRSSLPLALRWTIDVGAPPVSGAAPVSDDHRVYLALRTGQIAAYDLSDGGERWRKDIKVAHPMAVDAGLLFAATDDTVMALRVDDGALVWEADVVTTAPLFARDGWLVAISAGNVMAFRAADGARVWQRDIGATTVRPGAGEDKLFLAMDDARTVALKLADGEPVWEKSLGGATETPFVTNGRLYAGASDRYLYCLDAAKGEILWAQRLGGAPRGSASSDGSRVFVVTLDNLVRAYDLRSGNQRWQHGVDHRPMTGTVSLGGIVLVGSAASAEIWAWVAQSGKPAGSIVTPAEPAVPPTFVNRGAEGAFVFVVSGGLANQWKLTLLATAGDPPLVPLSALPGLALAEKR